MTQFAQKSIYLFSDSQLLFWQPDREYFLKSIVEAAEAPNPTAAYLGASNGDRPEFYDIFKGAMSNIGIGNCRQILSSFSSEDRLFLEKADIILLAGGDTRMGWEIFEQTGIKDVLSRRAAQGAILMGISAGAIQLGQYCWPENSKKEFFLSPTLGLVPVLFDAHDEANDWDRLKRIVKQEQGKIRGIGIPFGAGIVYHPDQSLEAIHTPSIEFSYCDGRIHEKTLTVQ